MITGRIADELTAQQVVDRGRSVRLFQAKRSDPLRLRVVEVAHRNGYHVGGVAITSADWTREPNGSFTLKWIEWHAEGGTISDIGGAYIVDGFSKCICVVVRSCVVDLRDYDLHDYESITLDNLNLRDPVIPGVRRRAS